MYKPWLLFRLSDEQTIIPPPSLEQMGKKSALLEAVLCLTTSHIRESTKGFLLTKYELSKGMKKSLSFPP
jgi:hypothetical protein